MEYGKCSRVEAVKLLRETNNDSVNAIMKLDELSSRKWLGITLIYSLNLLGYT